jgi:ABC-type transport system involved in multi-copper enzyme maturation permease subunit
MIDLLRSELLKLRSTRTTLGLVLGMVALTVFVALAQGFSTGKSSLSGVDDQRSLFGIGGVATLFAALVGVMAVTSEFRHGTIRPTLLFAPRRPRLLVAKLAAALATGALFGLLAEALAFGIGSLVLASRGIGFALDAGDVAALVAGTAGAALFWSGIGIGLGAVVRSQVGAMIGLFAWLLVAENILFGLAPSVGRYSPGPAGQGLAGAREAHLLAPGLAAVVLAGWVLAAAAAGTALFVRRDVA